MSTQGERTLTMYSDDKNIYIITPLNNSGPAPADAKPAPNIRYQSLDTNDPQYPLETNP